MGALVLFSGGQDSTVCLAWALDRFDSVETVGFDYGQRHHVEIAQRRKVLDVMPQAFPNWAGRLGDDHQLCLAELASLSETALTRDIEIQITESGLPSTFVPGRNLLFLTYAAAIAYRRGIGTLVGGMCETDYSGYPDCRNETVRALESAISLGLARSIGIETPLMWIDKAATWALADQLGGPKLIELIIEHTHTCYHGVRSTRYAWGYGCDDCPACGLRKAGYLKWRAETQEP